MIPFAAGAKLCADHRSRTCKKKIVEPRSLDRPENRLKQSTKEIWMATPASTSEASALGAGIWTKCSKSSQSKHVSAAPNSLHNEVSQPCNTVPAFWGTAGRSGPLPPPPPNSTGGKAAQPPHWLTPWPETSSHFLCFALIPHPSKQASGSCLPDMLCLSGHLDMHLVSRGSVVCQSQRQMDVH